MAAKKKPVTSTMTSTEQMAVKDQTIASNALRMCLEKMTSSLAPNDISEKEIKKLRETRFAANSLSLASTRILNSYYR